ncbi:MAG: hypothetical protein EXR54_01020 [Dehalococcoidia bacterium]|nr:hypothetical protein [Dehalococcoidia bacterium]MSQ16139.1 hypothetical protein [Dehalococcoidia bacterium]
MQTSKDETEVGTARGRSTEAMGMKGEPLTPLQEHYISLLQRLVALKNSYQTDAAFEQWLMGAINKAIYSALRDCIESGIGAMAKELLHPEHQVN